MFKSINANWKKAQSGYQLWIEEDPAILVSDGNFEQADEQLRIVVANNLGHQKFVINYLPLPPIGKTIKDWTNPKIYAVGWKNSVPSNARSLEMFPSGFCSRCGRTQGHRSKMEMQLASDFKWDVIGVREVSPALTIFSERFLALLTEDEQNNLKLAPVKGPKSFKSYYELQGDSSAPWVSFVGAKHHPITCWICPICKSRKLFAQHPELFAYNFISRADVPRPTPGVFVAGSPAEGLSLCLTEAKWKSIKGKSGTLGMDVSLVGVVPRPLVVNTPELPSPPEA